MMGILQANADQGVQYSVDASSQAKSRLGRDDFLKIFLTQLQYQDPLNPMEGTEFTAQLAQFSSLEQLFNVNENLGKIKSMQDSEARLQVLGLIGKQIKARGDSLFLEEGKEAKGAFGLDETADCTVIVEDQAGNVVRRISLGQLEAGQHVFSWDGLDGDGREVAPGSYKFSVLALDETGQAVPADTLVCGLVTRVSMGDETPVLYLGDVPITLTQVYEVEMPDNNGDTN